MTNTGYGGPFCSSPPSPDDLAGVAVGEFANATGMCGGILRIVPNQPLIFKV